MSHINNVKCSFFGNLRSLTFVYRSYRFLMVFSENLMLVCSLCCQTWFLKRHQGPLEFLTSLCKPVRKSFDIYCFWLRFNWMTVLSCQASILYLLVPRRAAFSRLQFLCLIRVPSENDEYENLPLGYFSPKHRELVGEATESG